MNSDGVTVHLTEREWGMVVNSIYARREDLENRVPGEWTDEYDALLDKAMGAFEDALAGDDTQTN